MYKWPDKDKDEIVDYSIDWSRFLESDTISAASWFIEDSEGSKVSLTPATVVDGLKFVTSTKQGFVTTIRLALGNNNIRYKVICQVLTLSGLKFERSVYVRIKEK